MSHYELRRAVPEKWPLHVGPGAPSAVTGVGFRSQVAGNRERRGSDSCEHTLLFRRFDSERKERDEKDIIPEG